jgi:hypothetical protein
MPIIIFIHSMGYSRHEFFAVGRDRENRERLLQREGLLFYSK